MILHQKELGWVTEKTNSDVGPSGLVDVKTVSIDARDPVESAFPYPPSEYKKVIPGIGVFSEIDPDARDDELPVAIPMLFPNILMC